MYRLPRACGWTRRSRSLSGGARLGVVAGVHLTGWRGREAMYPVIPGEALVLSGSEGESVDVGALSIDTGVMYALTAANNTLGEREFRVVPGISRLSPVPRRRLEAGSEPVLWR